MSRADNRDIYSSSGRRRDGDTSSFEDIYSQAKADRSRPRRPVNNRPPKRTKKKKKRRIWLRVVVILLVLLLLLAGGAVAAFFYYFGGLQTDNDFTTDPNQLAAMDKIDGSVTNIALFGVDSRENDDKGRSDTVMIASFDGVHKEIKLTSVLRDSRVVIDGYGEDKLAHAYSYGGPELAIKTLNQNFDMDIMEYITVNFTQMAQIIDAVGGVDIPLTPKEAVAANGLIQSTPDLAYSPGIPEIEEDQTVHLNGAQAVAYARIRKIDSETQRASRQQTVLQALFNQILNKNVLEYPGLIKQLLPYVETSLSYTDVLGLAPFAVSGKPTIANYKIPDEEDPDVFGGVVDGTWYWVYDIDVYAQKLHDFVYNQE